MVIRTVSQLPLIGEEELNDTRNQSFIEVSRGVDRDGDKVFVSNKAYVGDFTAICKNEVSSEMVRNHGLTGESGNPLNVNDINERVNRIQYGDISLSGIKEFNNYPFISADFPENMEKYGYQADNLIPNIKKVRDIVSDSPAFVSTTSSFIAEGNPFTTDKGTPLQDDPSIWYDYTIGRGDGAFYSWNIEAGGNDSSIKTNVDSFNETYQEMRCDGQLVVWGWLSDNGSVNPEMAWTGIFGKMKYQGGNNDTVWTPLQIQPWIRGQYSTRLQYVGFNVLVKKGLQIKIKTGFAVNETIGAYQNPGTLTFRDRYIPNTFFGYIIRNK